MIDDPLTRHIPVLLDEVVDYLGAARGGLFLDCTAGGGGHSEAILEANDKNLVVALDRDARAVDRVRARLGKFGERATVYHHRFSDAVELLQGRKFNGILADLGMSTDQLYEGRGFSFRDDSLDLRMDERAATDGVTLVNTLSVGELITILKEGGVGKEARNYAQAIARARPIASAAQLAEVISQAYHGPRQARHPAQLVLQAIRVVVNEEFEELDTLLTGIPKIAAPQARAVFISFHSKEDTLVTRVMRGWEGRDGFAAHVPGSQTAPQLGKLLTRRAIAPREVEVEENPSSRSARLRCFEFNGEEICQHAV